MLTVLGDGSAGDGDALFFQQLDQFLVAVGPPRFFGVDEAANLLLHGLGREFVTVVKGLVNVESGGDTDSLHHGDSANYRADVPHAIVNAGKGEAQVFLVVIYR